MLKPDLSTYTEEVLPGIGYRGLITEDDYKQYVEHILRLKERNEDA